uniref:CWF19 like cell cycle control factor 2 n=1 Tax=Neogobius melanostomus TaxID=47308 RepID=A0A8C6WS24_9GOBI
MAAFGSSFESASSIEERKESKRQARQEVLEKAKQQHEKEERRKELKRLRGEDTWMLPEVNQRLQEIEEESSGKKKKKEKKSKKKKEKKEKKKKDKKEKVTGPGDGSSDSSELFVLQRDEWMTFDFLAMKTTSTTERRAEKDKQKEEERAKAQAIEQAGLHKLELNPFWKDGGSGLPSEETADKVVQKASVVNDGGLSWLRKSYQRMKEQAEREQRSLSDVVSARYGSMEEFQQRLAEAEKAVYGERRGGEGSRRDRYRDRQRDRNGDGEKDRDNDGFRARDRNRDRERNRERDVNRGRDEDRDWDKDRERSSSSSSGKDRDQQPLSLGSLKSRFLKPSDEDDMTPEEQEVVLFRTDQSGRAWPVNAPSGSAEPHGGRRKKKAIETHVDGERVRYFQDDDHMGLQEMVRREKMSSAQDQNALYSRMAAKMMGKTDGDNYTLDDMFVSSAAQREGEGREEERMRSKAIGESRQLAATMEKCRHCFSSPDLPKHLVVALGSKAYLSLPAGVSMTEGHCIVCPLQHHSCATGLDEDVWGEMQIFRRALVRMFESQDLDCVFMETHMNPRRRQHMVLECIPLPKELGDMAPIYFKKAIMECDDEWAMNKKVVDLSSKDIRHAVPRGLPYFAVDFGMQGGFAHVIENEQKFPHYFGKEVVGGMMDLEPRRWRKLIKENFDDQRKKVLQFAQWWKPYDCTKTDD